MTSCQTHFTFPFLTPTSLIIARPWPLGGVLYELIRFFLGGVHILPSPQRRGKLESIPDSVLTRNKLWIAALGNKERLIF